MSNQAEIANELDLVHTMKDLILTYEEIYVRKMQKIRSSVIETRYFMERITKTYNDLKSAYKQELYEKGHIKTPVSKIQVPGLQKTKKSVAVLLSAEDKLSGEINDKLFDKFVTYINDKQSDDIVIAGKTGRRLFQQSNIHRPYRYFNLPEVSLTIEHLRPVVEFLVQYQDVNIFYGKFISFVRQEATKTNISGQEIKDRQINEGSESEVDRNKYIFEPSLEHILNFFETQIFTSLLRQTVNESLLAQIGSRIMTLQNSSSNIEERLKKLKYKQQKNRRDIANRKLLQSLSGLTLWYQ